jgi:hypothetical protein
MSLVGMIRGLFLKEADQIPSGGAQRFFVAPGGQRVESRPSLVVEHLKAA